MLEYKQSGWGGLMCVLVFKQPGCAGVLVYKQSGWGVLVCVCVYWRQEAAYPVVRVAGLSKKDWVGHD